MNADANMSFDNRSPWTDAFRAWPGSWAAAERQAAPAPTHAASAAAAQAPHPTLPPAGVEPEADWWASEALFDLYNL